MSVAEYTDNDLRLAVAAYCRDLCADETDYDPGHVFSDLYNERIRKILAVSRRQIHRRRVLHIAASIFIVLMLAFGAVMAFNEPVRATVINWTINIYNKLVDITFNHSEDDHAYIICTPGELPEGFELAENYHSGYYTRKVYKNAEGQYIKLEYRKPTEVQKRRIDKRGTSSEIITSSMGVQMFLSAGNGKCDLFWYDADRDLAFYVESNLDSNTLIRCFDILQMRLPLYEPTWLPDGYEEVNDFSGFLTHYIDYYYPKTGDYIYYGYSDMAETDMVFIDKLGDDIVVDQLLINGNQAYIFPETEGTFGSDLIIIDETNHIVFTISSMLEREDLLILAESITCKEP